jgi:hypothetical protein
MVKISSKFVIVIDVDHVLAADEVQALTDIQQGQVADGRAA